MAGVGAGDFDRIGVILTIPWWRERFRDENRWWEKRDESLDTPPRVPGGMPGPGSGS